LGQEGSGRGETLRFIMERPMKSKDFRENGPFVPERIQYIEEM
tara:strand:- start:500 stop:628 length:129 start_codon:yes stop_codon:yes gene_type:complete